MKSRFSLGFVGNLTLEETVIVVGCTVLMGFLVLASSSRANPSRAVETTPSYDLRRFEATAGWFSLDNNSLFHVSTPSANGRSEATYGGPFLVLPTGTLSNWTTELDDWAGKGAFANRAVTGISNALLRVGLEVPAEQSASK